MCMYCNGCSNSSDGWRALVDSGLYYNLSANIVMSDDNTSHIEVSGWELPSVRLTPDVAVAVSRQTGMPEFAGSVRTYKL